MNKILTVTLNPAIDVRYNVEKLDTGNINRTISIEKNAGGKGINVSRIIKKLGGDVLATGIVGGHTGKLFLSKLDKDGIKNNFIKTDFETRTCIAVIDKSTGKITELLESAEGKEKDFENFLKKYISILESGVKLVCGSGSILNGIQKDSYNILINEASKRGIKFILDTSGDTLIKGIEAKPFLIKPNQDELEDMFNKKFSTVNEIIEAARKIVKNAEPTIEDTIACIKTEQPFPVPRNNLYDRFTSGPVNPVFYQFFVKATAFQTDDTCIGCGQCVKNCPKNNIALENGKPIWGNQCTHCMACICYCPTEAIEYGKKSIGKPRYHFEQLKMK